MPALSEAQIQKIISDDVSILDELENEDWVRFQEFSYPLSDEENRQDYPSWVAFACAKNAVNILRRLLLDPHVFDAIAGDDNLPLRFAAANGHLEVVKLLLAKNADGSSYQFPAVVNAIAADRNSALHGAALNGHLEVVKLLLAKDENGTSYQFPAVVNDIAVIDNAALRLAAANGHLEVVKLLLAKDENGTSYQFPAVVNDIAAHENYALRFAAANGHLEVVKLLLAKNADGSSYQFPAVVNAIAADRNSALHGAALNGHLEVVKLLLAKDENGTSYQFPAVVNDIAVIDNAALCWAVENRHLEVVKLLLTFEPVFRYAEQHIAEYGAFVAPFVQSYLQNIRTQLAQETAHNHSPQDASFAAAVLLNLVRIGAPVEHLNLLLEIPGVLEHVTRNDNEILRLASRMTNQVACRRLIEITEVRELARINNFYENPNNGALGMSLAALATNAESSMIAFSREEQEQYQNLERRYQATLNQKGVNGVLDDFRQYLVERYNRAPASMTINKETIKLPFGWHDLQKLRAEKQWSDTDYGLVLQKYYENKFHTAHRFLATPNPWIAQNASYVAVDEANTSLRSANFMGYEKMIALFWLAARDESEPEDESLPKAQRINCETRKENFAVSLAGINRQHNWDKFRVNLITQKREQYDDMQGDKPSCFSGIKRGIFYGLLSHSALQSNRYIPTIAVEDAVKKCVYDFYKAYFASLSHDTLTSIAAQAKAYWEDVEVIPTVDNVSGAAINALKQELSTRYPSMQIAGAASIDAYLKQCFNADLCGGSHFLKFYEQCNLGDLLASNLEPTLRPN